MCSSVFWGKMYRLTLSLVTFVVCIQRGFSAAIQPREVSTEDIKNNLIGSDLAEDLTPPLLEAKNHFRIQSTVAEIKHPYVVEIHAKHLIIKTDGFDSEKMQLNKTETEGIQKLALSFVQLLNSSKLSPEGGESGAPVLEWSELNPVIILSNSGISLQFLGSADAEPNSTEISSEDRHVLWDFLTKYARNIFEEKLKQLNLAEKYAEVFDSPFAQTGSFDFQNFLDFLWSIMRLSVDYAETAFQGWTTSQTQTMTATEVAKKTRSSTATLLAYEEPSPFHEFPSQEFQYRRKDIDSIFYGRGVI